MRRKMRRKIEGILAVAAIFLLLLPVTAFAQDKLWNVTLEAEYHQTEARKMLSMLNDFRTSKSEAWAWNETDSEKVWYNTSENNTLSPLEYDYDLEAIAMQRAAEIALSWGHERPNGQICTTATYGNGHANGENIAMGYPSVESVMWAWKEGDQPYEGQGHRRNMLQSGYRSFGAGYAVVNGVECWVQEFSFDAPQAETAIDRDGVKQVSVEIGDEYINTLDIDAGRKHFCVEKGKSLELPELKANLTLKKTQESVGKVAVHADHEWNIKDEEIAKIEDGTVVGVSEGATQLTVTVLGRQETYTLTVLNGKEQAHSYTDQEVLVEPLCGSKGRMRYSCVICGDSYEADIPALEHIWKEVVIKEPTCTEYGTVYRECQREGCGAKYTEQSLRPVAHTIVVDPEVPATVTSTGLTEGSHCAVCGKVIKTQEIIPRLPQTTPSSPVAAAPTTEQKTKTEPDTETEEQDKDAVEDTTIREQPAFATVIQYTLSGKKKGFVVKWKKSKGLLDGYEISYSKYKSGKKAKVIRVASSKKSYQKKGLKSKKKYYVKIRTYRIERTQGKKQIRYSAWSRGKSVKTR